MNLVFENIKEYKNFTNCSDVNLSTISRFSTSPIEQSAMHSLSLHKYSKINFHVKSFEFAENLNLSHYIIPTGVTHHPNDWTGSYLVPNNTRQNSFSYLGSKYLKDLQSGRAMVMFDQSHEGYQTSWLWQYFHEECEKYNVPPQAIIYVTGNLLANQQYVAWADSKNLLARINVIPYTVFEYDIGTISQEVNLISDLRQNYEHKKNNLENIKTFNCLQKRLRAHRIWFYKYLADAQLLDYGLISMNPFEPRMSFFEGKHLSQIEVENLNKNLPRLIYGENNNKNGDNYYIRRITDDVFINSWVSVISEAAAGESDQTIFISEKMFKPIVCFHPFIVVSNQGYLEKLRQMGYKTFHGYIDESYDTLPTVFERYQAIIIAIQKIHAIEDKLAWYKSIEHILLHNYSVFHKNIAEPNSALHELSACYRKYFKV